jgi:hypothetical protein
LGFYSKITLNAAHILEALSFHILGRLCQMLIHYLSSITYKTLRVSLQMSQGEVA